MLIETGTLLFIKEIMEKNILMDDLEIISNLHKRQMLILTDDGTYTFKSEDAEELMHSRMGAKTEAFEKFADPSEISTMYQPRILDLCSGLGYNTLAALNRNAGAQIDMVEISRELIFISQFLNRSCKEQDTLKTAVSDFFSNKKNQQISIFCNDARSVLTGIPSSLYDVVFHDGFSPAKDPALYTVEFLELIFRLINGNGILLSYSSSIPFRSALIEAGFHIGEGPAIGRERGITIAAKNKNDHRIKKRLSYWDEQFIALSTIGIPFHDEKLQNNSESIATMREEQRETARNTPGYISTKKIKKGLVDPQYTLIQEKSADSRESILQMRNFFNQSMNK
jgi:tRNA U34 5-methylaminomethyl-2-thiouridine-forming methyltransferase MnmC